jgi:predicted nucleic acid-binding protein
LTAARCDSRRVRASGSVEMLDIVAESGGELNANDALLVALEREGAIDVLATFDARFDEVEGFRRFS